MSMSPNETTVEIAAPTEDEMNDWVSKIRETALSVNAMVTKRGCLTHPLIFLIILP